MLKQPSLTRGAKHATLASSRSFIVPQSLRVSKGNDKRMEQVRKLISYEPDIIEFCRSAAGYTASERAARSRGATAQASTFVPLLLISPSSVSTPRNVEARPFCDLHHKTRASFRIFQ